MDPNKERLDFAVQIASEAGAETLKFFRHKDLSIDRKGDGSPVTRADRDAETLLRRRIGERFPADGIVGEEFDDVVGASGYKWVLDPIDGTKSFIHGVPLYTTLVAAIHEDQASDRPGESVLGVVHAPATGETVYAHNGGGCWYTAGDGPPTRARVSKTAKLDEGLILTCDEHSFSADRGAAARQMYLDLQQKARLSRTWGDGYGYLMVACGRAEVMIDPVLSIWDIAPMLPVIQEAGGRLTDWSGQPTIHSGEAVATNGLLHDEVLQRTKGL